MLDEFNFQLSRYAYQTGLKELCYAALTSQQFTAFNIHGTVHRSMTSSNNQRDAA